MVAVLEIIKFLESEILFNKTDLEGINNFIIRSALVQIEDKEISGDYFDGWHLYTLLKKRNVICFTEAIEKVIYKAIKDYR